MTTDAFILPATSRIWRDPALAALSMLALLLGLYYQTGAAMVSIWLRSETYAHAFVVPPIVVWLVWRRRHELATLTPTPWPWALMPMAAAAVLWLLGELVTANAATQLAFTAMLVLVVPLVLGRQVASMLMFPLAFSFFAVPGGEFLTPTLMQWTADFTVMAVRASGVPVFREGLQFVIPSGNWSVVEACSGIRYLMASFMVGSLFAYLNYQSSWRRAVFIAVSILLPVVANWLRAYMIVMLGHLSDNKIATGADHLLYGWVFFGIVIIGMFFIGARWAEVDAPPKALHMITPPAMRISAMSMWGVFATFALLAILPVALSGAMNRHATDRQITITLPTTLPGGWVAGESPLSDWVPQFANASTKERKTYTGPEGRVEVHISYYQNQSEARKLVSSGNSLVRSEDRRWNQIRQDSRRIILGGHEVRVLSSELFASSTQSPSGRERLSVWHFYWINGVFTSSDLLAKVLSAWDRLRGRTDDSAAIFVVSTNAEGSTSDEILNKFLVENLSLIERSLAMAGGRAAEL